LRFIFCKIRFYLLAIQILFLQADAHAKRAIFNVFSLFLAVFNAKKIVI